MTFEKLNRVFDRVALPCLIVVVTLFVLSAIYNLTLRLDDLVRIDGEVFAIRIEEERRSKGTDDIFYVYLTNGAKLKIMDDGLFTPYRNLILNKVKPGDQVVIFRRTRLQTSLGAGTVNLIYQFEHDEEILMPLAVMQRNFKRVLIIESLLLAGLCTTQVFRSRKRSKGENKGLKMKSKKFKKKNNYP